MEKLLKDYHLEEHLPEMKEWYNGYHFGNANIYCPWDVINHIDVLCKKQGEMPQCYWINSSGNALVKRFIALSNRTTRDEIERLIAGEPIEKNVRLELTYDEIDNSIDRFADIIIEPEDPDAGIIIELKYSKEAFGLDKACEIAMKQIRDRRYYEYLRNDGRQDIMFYGIAFYKKRCKVIVERLKERFD